MAWHDSTIVSAAVPAAEQQGDLNTDRAPRLKSPPQSKGRAVKSKGTKRPYKAMTVDGDDEEEYSNHVVDEEEEEDSSAQPAGAEVKKRVRKGRLSTEQLNFLEMSFEEENKLEPHRKALIAKHLGLVPRQVAIWFQNRRARWKNKQLEQAYLDLSARHDSTLKDNEDLIKRNDEVLQENKRLQEEVARLLAIIQAAKHSSEVSKGAAVNSGNVGDLVQCPDSSSENTASTCDQVIFHDTADKEEQQVTIGSQSCRSGLPENSCNAHGSDQSCICSEISFFELSDPSQPLKEIEDLKTFYGEEVVNGNLLSYHSLFQLQAGVFLEDAYTVLVDPSVGLLWYD